MSIDDLTFVKLLDKEVFSEFYLTLKKDENLYYITKIINKSENFSEIMKYINCEINILKDTNHPNISKLFEVRETSEKIYIIKEYYNGGNLGNFLNEYKKRNHKPPSEEIVQYIMRQIIEGIKYLHNKKIIHRDLKLENIILHYEDENDRINNNIMKAKIKIFDFGFAKYLKKGELTKTILGTPLYMDPILLLKSKAIPEYKDYEYDEKVDIWSLGILFYRLLVGKNPFVAMNKDDLIEKMKKGEYSVPGTVSEEAFLMLTNMLQFESNKRPSIDILYNYDFLRKNVNQFKKIDENLIVNSKVVVNIKNNN